jgi:hypothetical protein
MKNHSKVKSHISPPKHLQIIPEPKEQNVFQSYINLTPIKLKKT